MREPFFTRYSPAEIRHLFQGVQVSPILPYRSSPLVDEEFEQQDTGCISVSGAQEKYSLVVEGTTLRYAQRGEQGQYILKPRPHRMKLRADMPVNEWLSMSLAKSVFGLPTADCTLCFYGDGEPAYLTRRFDLKPDGTKRRMEDLASLANVHTQGNSGAKYEGSYESLAALIARYSVAPRIQLSFFFRYLVVNFLLCNGDAHMKNFALLEDDAGGLVLAPVYDMMNTRLHVEDTPFALSRGLFDDARPVSPRGMGAHFLDWGAQIGLPGRLCSRFLAQSLSRLPAVEKHILCSCLSEKAAHAYLSHVRERFLRLKKGTN